MASAKERSVEGNNGASDTLTSEFPFMARALLRGTTDLLFHRWNTDEVAAKSAAMKSSVAKRTDNTESYLYRNQDGVICIPGEYVRQAIIHSAKYSPDPRSPRKSAMDLVKAGVQVMTALAPIGVSATLEGSQTRVVTGTTTPDYLDQRRVVVQRNGITRTRPAFFAGWVARFEFLVVTPELIPPSFLRELLDRAGKLVGIADFRPTFGRFAVDAWEIGIE